MSAAIFPESRVLKYRLYNFSFPTMSWGQHRVFRCVNSIAETGLSGAVSTDMERQRDTHCAKIQSSTPPSGGCSEKESSASDAATAATATTVPWNHRKMRAACFSPWENGRSQYASISPSNWQFGRVSPGRVDLKSWGQRRKFPVSLSREIEGDFYVFMGMPKEA